MRLTNETQRSIRPSVREADPTAAVYRFGSRVDDARRGGEIDLLVLSRRIGLRERLRLLLRPEDRHGAQRIDLVVKPFHHDASAAWLPQKGRGWKTGFFEMLEHEAPNPCTLFRFKDFAK